MNTALLLLSKTALFIALMIPGYILGRCKSIDRSAVPSVCNILTSVAMPALVLLKLLETDFSKLSMQGILISLLLPAAVVPVLMLISFAVFRNSPDKGASTFIVMFPNCGFIGIPLSAAMFPDRPEITVYISVVNVTTTVLLLTLGVYAISGDRKEISLRKILLNPAIIAAVLGGILSACGIAGKLGAVTDYLTFLSQLTTPLAMIILGFEFVMPGREILCSLKSTVMPSFLRLILSPVLAMTLLWIAKACGVNVGPDIVSAIFIAMALSPAASSPAMAARYGQNGHRAAVTTVVCTLLCLATLPLLYLLVELIFKI